MSLKSTQRALICALEHIEELEHERDTLRNELVQKLYSMKGVCAICKKETSADTYDPEQWTVWLKDLHGNRAPHHAGCVEAFMYDLDAPEYTKNDKV